MVEDSAMDRILELKERLKKTPVNKGTEKDRARLKAQIAKLQEKRDSQKKKGGYGYGYGLKKHGDLTVCLVGYPSTGKSTLLNALTGAKSEIGEYEFTTLQVIPGAINLNGADVQIWDVPGLIEGASEGKGRGKEVIGVIRNADVIVLLTDPKRLPRVPKLLEEIYNGGVRLNQEIPDVKIEKKDRGGIQISSTVKLEISDDVIKEMCREYGVTNGNVTIRSEIDEDQFLDVLSQNRVYLSFILIINKIDLLDRYDLEKVQKEYPDAIYISAQNKLNLNILRNKIWEKSGLMRIYMKKIGAEADTDEPLIVRRNSSVEDICSQIHAEFLRKFKFARLWGMGAKFDGQKIGRDQILQDEDILELHFSK